MWSDKCAKTIKVARIDFAMTGSVKSTVHRDVSTFRGPCGFSNSLRTTYVSVCSGLFAVACSLLQ